MRVLFISSSNSAKFNVSPFIKAQGEALTALGVDVSFFPIKGKGIIGYYKSGLRLRKYLKNNDFDIIHAHFSLSGWSAIIGSIKIPIVLSLMGSDAYGEFIGENKVIPSSKKNTLLTYCIQPFVSKIISKSKNIEKYVYLKNKSHVIPNGVLLNKFYPINEDFRKELGLQNDKLNVLYLGDKKNVRKNYLLAKKAINLVNNSKVQLIAPNPVPYTLIPKYLNAVDVLLLTSFAEGSPNIIKEAMACNLPIVSTKVGDVEWLLNELEGCYVASFDPFEFSKKLIKALEFSEKTGRTKGRNRIIELGLDSKTIASKIIKIYNSILDKS